MNYGKCQNCYKTKTSDKYLSDYVIFTAHFAEYGLLQKVYQSLQPGWGLVRLKLSDSIEDEPIPNRANLADIFTQTGCE